MKKRVNENKKVKVYRIEHVQNRHGPYLTQYGGAFWHDANYVEPEEKNPILTGCCPNRLFGFVSRGQLARWFNKPTLRKLRERGFVVRSYEVPIHTIIFGTAQVAFHKPPLWRFLALGETLDEIAADDRSAARLEAEDEDFARDQYASTTARGGTAYVAKERPPMEMSKPQAHPFGLKRARMNSRLSVSIREAIEEAKTTDGLDRDDLIETLVHALHEQLADIAPAGESENERYLRAYLNTILGCGVAPWREASTSQWAIEVRR